MVKDIRSANNYDQYGRLIPAKNRSSYPADKEPAEAVTGNPTNPIVVFMATSTPEKIRDFRFIAEEKKLPIIFDDIHELLGAFHSAEEIGVSTAANAGKKMTEVKPEELTQGDNPKNIQAYLKARGLPENTEIYCGTEDSGFFVPEKIWNKVDKSGIKKDSLTRIEEEKAANQAPPGMKGPGVESGPAMSGALGPYTLMKRILNAIATVGKEEANVLAKPQKTALTMKSTVTLINIKDAAHGAAPKPFEALAKLSLLPDHEGIEKLTDKEKVSTYHFYTPDGKNSMVDLGREGVAKYSARAQVVDNIFTAYFPRNATYDHAFRHQDLLNPEDAQSKTKYKVGSFSGTSSVLEQMKEVFKKNELYKDYEMILPDGLHHSDMPSGNRPLSDAYQTLASVDEVIRNSDAAVLLPDTHKGSEMNELMKLYTLFSLEVNKQLNARDMEKPIYILNHDGSWDNALKIHYDLANSNMTKDFDISPTSYSNGNDRIKVRSTSYFDVIGAASPERPISFEDSTKALKKLLEIKRMGYTRRTSEETEVFESHGDDVTRPQEFGGFKVAFFCSASCENEQLNQGVNNLGYDLVKDDFGIIYGGGDRYTMGALLKGVERFRQELPEGTNKKHRAWIGGYSTEEILKSETENGRFSSELSYHKQTKDIYQRMADMLSASDAVVVAPGGAGTVQEWVAALILNKEYPDLAKPIIFYDPPLNTEQKQIWSKALKIALGKEDYNALTGSDQKAKEAAQHKHNVYIETEQEAVMKRLHEARELTQRRSNDEHNGKVEPDRLVSSRWAAQIAQESATSPVRMH